MHALNFLDSVCEFKIGLVGIVGDNVYAMYLFVILYCVIFIIVNKMRVISTASRHVLQNSVKYAVCVVR